MGLFKKKQVKVETLTAEKIIMEQLNSDDDAYVTDLARQMMAGSPLILNFERLHIDRANKVIAFMSGVVYAISGHIVEINETTYLFGNQELYQDGSVEDWLRTNLN
ncbi:cell division protein SepF [Acholeplasma equirhinis]|uniref:cell division protein SepF n=1 Tax=Acholeplasma equirhinis TaxID=555393 RepID=UPI00197AB7B5|nr:cell division protein SepF [Acholeplasma equirhinis]MBN3490386.1 cell division protein SepF [Acholeplasma equirhinis]